MGCINSKSNQVAASSGEKPSASASPQANQVAPAPVNSTPVPEGLEIKSATVDELLLHAKAQNTHRFRAANQDRQIVRRGCAALFTVTTSTGNLDQKTLESVVKPRFTNKLNDQVLTGCSVTLGKSADKTMHELLVTIPVTAPFGFFHVEFQIGDKDSCKVNEELVILFNPWNKDDPVHMQDESLLSEYILADHGLLFTGNQHKINRRAWVYGQFTRQALDACAIVLHGTDEKSLSDPVLLSRIMSAKVNSQDDRGILAGNWSGKYDDGTAPYKWTGASDILKQYVISGGTPVKYGQCWVFSGVLTACLRGIGIPCRSVTNYSSGHDTQCNKTLDRYFKKSGEVDHRRTSDSVWNFHVWNEAWMDRKDLPAGRGGWQAIDSTPQERSDGIFQTGPASLVAIKEGEDGDYDNKFVFAEVNADVRYWEEDASQPNGYRLIRTDPKSIGCSISTKAVGKNEREDVTLGYKYPEGSAMERAAVLHGMFPTAGVQVPKSKVNLKLELVDDDDALVVGEPVLVKLTGSVSETATQNQDQNQNTGENAEQHGTSHAKNSDNAVRYSVFLYATDYRGGERRLVKDFTGEKIAPFVEEFEIKAEDYSDFIAEASMSGELLCHAIIGTESDSADEVTASHPATFVETRVFDLSIPGLQVKLPENLCVGEEAEAVVTFTNPLKKELTNCKLAITGAGLQVEGHEVGEAVHQTLPDSIGGNGGKLEHKLKFKRNVEESVRLVITLNCDQLHGISGDAVYTS